MIKVSSAACSGEHRRGGAVPIRLARAVRAGSGSVAVSGLTQFRQMAMHYRGASCDGPFAVAHDPEST